jgi:hypothetical protein
MTAVIAQIMEGANITETSITFHKFTQHNMPEGCHLLLYEGHF